MIVSCERVPVVVLDTVLSYVEGNRMYIIITAYNMYLKFVKSSRCCNETIVIISVW